MKEKQFIDFCRGEAFLFRLGRVCYQKAHAPLSKHVHGRLRGTCIYDEGTPDLSSRAGVLHDLWWRSLSGTSGRGT